MKGEVSNRLTMKEAAAHLGHSYSWIYTQHRSLGLNGYRIGGRWYFNLEDLQAWEANLKRYGEQHLRGKSPKAIQSGRVSFT